MSAIAMEPTWLRHSSTVALSIFAFDLAILAQLCLAAYSVNGSSPSFRAQVFRALFIFVPTASASFPLLWRLSH